MGEANIQHSVKASQLGSPRLNTSTARKWILALTNFASSSIRKISLKNYQMYLIHFEDGMATFRSLNFVNKFGNK